MPFVIPTTDRSLTISTYNRTSPYIQNWNLEIQREIAHNTTVEVRYLGTKGTKLWGNINLNQVDALHHNRDLYDAFIAVRAVASPRCSIKCCLASIWVVRVRRP